ncbi:efflux RND transporter periplasmic adaptor subunit, partial [candidate division KSB1 bacterium]|nr:efflux RND transporter periplasmic adaptor subunit [candidate division KSB1 bacterium]
MKSKIAIAVILATVGVSFVAWSRWNSEKTGDKSEALPLAVNIQVVQPANITQSLTVSGTLVGEDEATVVSETNGKIVAVKAQVGDWLNKGQTIVQVENDLKQVALEQAKAQALAAKTNYEKAQKDLERYEELFKQQITTQSVIENARLAAQAAEAQLKSAEAAVRLAQRQYDDTFIKAPLAGRLADRYVNEAAMVMPGDKIGVVVNGRNMKLKTSVAENEIAALRNGQNAEVVADALPQMRFAGKVVSVAQKANHERTYPVEILVQNDEIESLKSGMFGRASVQVANAQAALVIPIAAVLTENNNSYVFVEENGVAKRVEVQLGLQQDQQVQIKS